MNEDLLVRARDIVRNYADKRAVDGLSLDVARGEILGFLGPNGAGKSTTLRIIAGVLAPHGGSVSICGIDLLEDPRAAKARIGFLPETPPVNRELTVAEFLRICAGLHGLAGRRGREACERALSLCDLGSVAGRLIGNLSKGFQQRVGIAQAIVHNPSLVILDEPTVGLDPLQIRDIRALIAALADAHGVILSTHILPEVQQVCTRVAIINAGRIVLDEALGPATEGNRLRLRLRRAPAAADLRAVPGLLECTPSAPGEWLLRHDGDPGAAERVAAAAVAGDWGLLELAPAADSLEERFLRLTYGRDDPAREPVAP